MGWRLLRGLVSLVTTLLMLAGVGLATTLALSLPPSAQSVEIPSLAAPVAITFDQDGVPRIRARTPRRCARCAGVCARPRPHVSDGHHPTPRRWPAGRDDRPGRPAQ